MGSALFFIGVLILIIAVIKDDADAMWTVAVFIWLGIILFLLEVAI